MDTFYVIVWLLIFAVGTLIGVSLMHYLSNKWHKEEIMVYKDKIRSLVNNNRDDLYETLYNSVKEEYINLNSKNFRLKEENNNLKLYIYELIRDKKER